MSKSTRALSALAVASLAALTLSACSTARMAVPPTLSKEAKPMAVQKTYKFWIFGLKKLDFGTYKVTDYHTGWQNGKGAGVSNGKIGYSADKNAQKYEFRMTGQSGKIWAGQCAEAASKQTVSGKLLGGTLSADLERQATLDCVFQQEQGSQPWTMALKLKTSGKGLMTEENLAGEFSDGTRKFTVEGTNDLEGTAMGNGDVTGFSIKDDSKVLGAVQVINKPLVWMDPAAEPDMGEPLALASTALMLQKGLLKQLDAKDDK
jgi:hypothetical protein